MAQEEPLTITWFAIRLGPSTFGIFDGFSNETGRQEHLSGKIAATLKEKTLRSLNQPPMIEKFDVIAAKLPQVNKDDYEEYKKILTKFSNSKSKT